MTEADLVTIARRIADAMVGSPVNWDALEPETQAIHLEMARAAVAAMAEIMARGISG